MSNGVLSRDELHAAYRAGGPEGLTHYERLALVEAAVLEKTRGTFHTTAYWSAGQSMVTEREARKRERAAWEACVAYCRPLITVVGTGAARDRLYPLPSCDKCGQKLP